MTAKLQLYRFIEDAWNDSIRDWCKRASQRSLEGWQCWMIVANRGQTRWFKQQSLAEGITSFGLHYLEPHMLRRELCALLGVDAQFPGDETLEFLLKVEALRRSDPESVSVSRNPTACLHPLSEIASAGWHRDVSALKTMPPAAGDFFAVLQKSKSWMPEVDRELMGHAAKKRLMCCVVGWDAGSWQQINLFDVTARSSEECEVYVPMPRAQGEKLHHDWVTALESRLNVAIAACKAGGFESGNEGLVERLEGADLNKPGGARPEFLIGQEWRDEMQLVRDHILAWLDSSEGSGRLAVVVPRRSPSSMQIVRALADAGIELLDETGERQEAPLDTQIQRQMVRYHLLDCDVDALLDLVALLHQRAPEACIDPIRARAMLHRRFAEVQSRNARLIVPGADGLRELAGIVEKLGRWEDEITWTRARKQWEDCVREFAFEHRHPRSALVAGGRTSRESQDPRAALSSSTRAMLSGSIQRPRRLHSRGLSSRLFPGRCIKPGTRSFSSTQTRGRGRRARRKTRFSTMQRAPRSIAAVPRRRAICSCRLSNRRSNSRVFLTLSSIAPAESFSPPRSATRAILRGKHTPTSGRSAFSRRMVRPMRGASR